MNLSLEKESQLLKESWAFRDKQELKSYLATGINDPRIQIQSILTRHFLIEKLFGDKFHKLMHQELGFALTVNRTHDFAKPLSEEKCNLFQQKWKEALIHETAIPIKVIEPACGSANDYRFFDAYGMAPFLKYKGFDIAGSNIENAKEMFPNVDFEEGNILNLKIESGAYDYLIVHDLFEHLSLEALEVALSEACRIAAKGMIIAFFNMFNFAEHFIVPVKKYHWNQLSEEKIEEFLMQRGWKVKILKISRWLSVNFNYGEYHNEKAYTFIITK